MPARRHLRFALGALVILLLLLAGGGAAYWRFRPGEQQSAHRLSIVVLPLTNLSNEPEQEYFAEAVTDDLAADLARIEDSFVIAQSTARAYKGIDPKRVGHELGVRYILDGSLRRTEFEGPCQRAADQHGDRRRDLVGQLRGRLVQIDAIAGPRHRPIGAAARSRTDRSGESQR